MGKWRAKSVDLHQAESIQPLTILRKCRAKKDEIYQTDLVLPVSWERTTKLVAGSGNGNAQTVILRPPVELSGRSLYCAKDPVVVKRYGHKK